MRGPQLATLLLILAAVSVAIAIYYVIPGYYHVLTFSHAPTDSHPTHFVAFLALAVVAFLGSRFVRSSAGN